MKKKAYTFICWLLCLNATFAQTDYTLTGKVSANSAGLDLATVALLLPDSSLVLGTYTESDGSFNLTPVKSGDYLMRTSFLGYESAFNNITVSGNAMNITLPEIKLQAATGNINLVTVTAKIPFIERKNDRIIVNPDALASNTGTTVLEALEKTPGVSVDPNGDIKLKGRSGVLVLIDDKPTYMSGTELQNYLNAMPTSNVKHIELMTNPPAKYDAAGSAGIINIVTKRSKVAGFMGGFNLSANQGKYTRSNNSFNLSLNHSKFSVHSNINAGIRNGFQDLYIYRYYKDANDALSSSFEQNSYIQPKSQSISAQVSFDYYLSDKATIGTSVKGLFNPSQVSTDNTAYVKDAASQIAQRVVADNNQNGSFNNGTFNLNYRQILDSLGSKLVVDADYVLYRADELQDYKNYVYTPNDSLIYQDQINGQTPSDIRIYALKADYSKPFAFGGSLEAGLKSAFTQTDNQAIYSNTLNGITTPNYDLSNRFKYAEWIHAAYLNYAQSFGRFDVQLGLRAEHTRMDGNQLGNPIRQDSSFQRNYTNVFPTLYTTWRMDSLGKHSMSFSYGRRIDRPIFENLNPFISPLDKFTFYAGNPNLLPTYSNSFTLSYAYGSIISADLSYSKTKNVIAETLEIRDSVYYFSRPGNLANNDVINLSVNANIPIAKWYTLNIYAEAGNMAYQSPLYTQQLNASGNYAIIVATNMFQLGKGWSGDIRADFQSGMVYAQLFLKKVATLNFGIQKKLFKDKATIKLSVNDVLYSRKVNGIINNLAQTDASWHSRFDSRFVALSFSMRFGKGANTKPKHIGTGSESEQNRVKS